MVVADALGDVLPLGPIVPIIRTALHLTQPRTLGYCLNPGSVLLSPIECPPKDEYLLSGRAASAATGNTGFVALEHYQCTRGSNCLSESKAPLRSCSENSLLRVILAPAHSQVNANGSWRKVHPPQEILEARVGIRVPLFKNSIRLSRQETKPLAQSQNLGRV